MFFSLITLNCATAIGRHTTGVFVVRLNSKGIATVASIPPKASSWSINRFNWASEANTDGSNLMQASVQKIQAQEVGLRLVVDSSRKRIYGFEALNVTPEGNHHITELKINKFSWSGKLLATYKLEDRATDAVYRYAFVGPKTIMFTRSSSAEINGWELHTSSGWERKPWDELPSKFLQIVFPVKNMLEPLSVPEFSSEVIEPHGSHEKHVLAEGVHAIEYGRLGNRPVGIRRSQNGRWTLAYSDLCAYLFSNNVLRRKIICRTPIVDASVSNRGEALLLEYSPQSNQKLPASLWPDSRHKMKDGRVFGSSGSEEYTIKGVATAIFQE